MADPNERLRIADHPPVRRFLDAFAGRPVEAAEVERAIRDEAERRKASWSWVDRFAAEELAGWTNDRFTLAFEVDLAGLAGERCLEFTEAVWRLKPSRVEHSVWAGRAFVRLWWDPDRRLAPREGVRGRE